MSSNKAKAPIGYQPTHAELMDCKAKLNDDEFFMLQYIAGCNYFGHAPEEDEIERALEIWKDRFMRPHSLVELFYKNMVRLGPMKAGDLTFAAGFPPGWKEQS